MSLFSDDQYQWRETYFVVFQEPDRPAVDTVVESLSRVGRFEVSDVRADEQGRFESLTLKSPDDFSGIDITYVTGEEVSEQVDELVGDLIKATLTPEERKKLDRLGECDSRFDIYHFEQVGALSDAEEEEFLDPGGLLIVMEQLAELCNGISVDPASGTFMS